MEPRMGHCLILGADSDIGKAIAHRYAKAGFNLYLTSRNTDHIDTGESIAWKKDFPITIKTLYFEALDFASHTEFYLSLPHPPAVVVCVFGYLGNQNQAQVDFQEAKKIIDSNFTAQVSILSIIANDMEQKRGGCIIGVSSVAGDRGRKSNYFYGASKGAFSIFLSGLRNRLSHSSVHVMTVKPGYIRTKMTKDLVLPPWLTDSPDHLAEKVFQAYVRKQNITYHLPIWRYIMQVIKWIPESIFKTLQL